MKKKELDERKASYRINHLTWWKEEMPNKEEMDYLLHNLEKNDNKVDFIFYFIFYTAPSFFITEIKVLKNIFISNFNCCNIF